MRVRTSTDWYSRYSILEVSRLTPSCAVVAARRRIAPAVALLVLALAGVGWRPRPVGADEAPLAAALSKLSPNVFSDDDRDAARQSLSRDLGKRIQAANDASRDDWSKIKTRDAWRPFRDGRVKNLREALGRWPAPPKKIRHRVTGSVVGDGYVVDNIVFESRPGLWVTANLYRPSERPASLAGILISHSHHAPKHQRELQDMGATWARGGCYVLVCDHLGHGERGQHGLVTAADYPEAFRVGRQDYYFRYDSSVQLYLAGDTLMGWMAWDLMRGVDLLLTQPNIDARRILALGGVAGGGDPCAVAAALDERIACAVPFNFGGPQPETRYPLPDDAETWFNYAGGGSWESTRNLAFSARQDRTFLPWEIVAAIAPRRLVYGHEFSWDRQRDPVWRRFERVWNLHDAIENLAFAHGRGELSGSPPAATHCGNIGAEHREAIHAAFRRWFDIDAKEYSRPRPAGELTAMTPAAKDDLKPRKLHELLRAEADAALASMRMRRQSMSASAMREALQADWVRLLGRVDAYDVATIATQRRTFEIGENAYVVERVAVRCEDDLRLPLMLLSKERHDGARRPAVLCLSQTGKAGFLDHRAEDVARLVEAGCIVCLADVRDTGETASSDDRGQFSASTDRAAAALMIGDPLVAQQLRDARSILALLRSRDDVDAERVAVWGASFAPPNAADANLRAPRRIDNRPRDAEPLGGLLTLLLGVYEDSVAAMCVDGGLIAFCDVLDSPFTYVPLESVVPGLLTVADAADLAAAAAPRPLQMSRCVDAMNRRVAADDVANRYRLAVAAYEQRRAAAMLVIGDETAPGDWLASQIGSARRIR